MKKLLLSALAVSASLFSFGQDNVTIYGPEATFTNGSYAFDGITIAIDTVAGVKGPIVATGSTTGYYVGGFGLSNFTGPGMSAELSSGYTGTVANTTVKMTATTASEAASIKLQLKSGEKVFGYIVNLEIRGSEYSFPASELKELGGPNNDPIGEVITEAEFAAISEFQMTFNCGANMGVCDVDVSVESWEFDAVVSSTEESLTNVSTLSFPNPATNVINFSNELNNVVVLNSMGDVVITEEKATSLNVANLTSGVYFVKSNKFNSTFVVK